MFLGFAILLFRAASNATESIKTLHCYLKSISVAQQIALQKVILCAKYIELNIKSIF